jgi:predicted nucleic acid-binding protein
MIYIEKYVYHWPGEGYASRKIGQFASDQITYYDANICAAAILSGAESLVSENMQDSMQIEGIIIENPFC